MTRLRKEFLKDWRFYLGDPQGAETPDFDDEAWRALELPHDWGVDYPLKADHPSGGGGGYAVTGIGWYRKHFELPGEMVGKKVSMMFDGVYMDSTVYLNGQKIGGRAYGYSSFSVDLTSALREGENIVAVRVNNSHQPSSRWYTGSGIYRNVWLDATENVHVAQWGVFCATNGLYKDNTVARLQLSVLVDNETDAMALVKVRHELFDAEGKLCMMEATPLQITAGSSAESMTCPSVENIRLWTDRDPYLYTLKTTIEMDGAPVDEVETRVGIRTATFDCDKGFLLNGRQVKIKGMCVHHDCGLTGAVGYRETWQRRLARLKDMGCNGIRTSHNPPSPELLDLCDEMGFLVMDEAFDEWLTPKRAYGYGRLFTNNAAEDLETMLRRDRNHPSIVIWSIGNEIPEQPSVSGIEVLRMLRDICHREDPFRMVTLGCDNIASVEPSAALREFENELDVVGYNYVGRWRNRAETLYDEDRELFPKRRMIGTENPTPGGIRGDYNRENAKYGDTNAARNVYDTATLEHEFLWRYTITRDFVSGDYLWTGIDYLGETRGPRKGAIFGAMDTAGFPKDCFYYLRSIWNPDQITLHLLPHWNWAGHEGEFMQVIAYTNCEEVRLYINDRLISTKGFDCPNYGAVEVYNKPAKGTHPTTTDLHLVWDVPYEPGELKAVGYIGGKVVAEEAVRTTGAAVTLKAEADRERIPVSGVAHVEISTQDAKGLHVPGADNMVHVKVTGPARLLGLDNGSMHDLTMYGEPSRKLFAGYLLAMIKATDKGDIDLEITCDGMDPIHVKFLAE